MLAQWQRRVGRLDLPQHISGKIGYLHPITISPGHISFSLLQKEWQRLGYIDGETVLARSGENDLRRLPGLIRDLTGLGVGVLPRLTQTA